MAKYPWSHLWSHFIFLVKRLRIKSAYPTTLLVWKPSHFLKNPANICPSPCDVIFRPKESPSLFWIQTAMAPSRGLVVVWRARDKSVFRRVDCQSPHTLPWWKSKKDSKEVNTHIYRNQAQWWNVLVKMQPLSNNFLGFALVIGQCNLWMKTKQKLNEGASWNLVGQSSRHKCKSLTISLQCRYT